MTALGITLLVVLALTGLVAIPFGLPGIFIIAGGYLSFGLCTGEISWGFFVLILVFAGLSELFEWIVSAYGARRLGTSRQGVIGAIAGGIAGALIGVPVFLVGSVLGLFLGAFLGALILEYMHSSDFDKSVRSAAGALLARATAIAVKFILGTVSVVAIIFKAVKTLA